MRRVRSKMRWRFRHRIAAMRGVPKGDDLTCNAKQLKQQANLRIKSDLQIKH